MYHFFKKGIILFFIILWFGMAFFVYQKYTLADKKEKELLAFRNQFIKRQKEQKKKPFFDKNFKIESDNDSKKDSLQNKDNQNVSEKNLQQNFSQKKEGDSKKENQELKTQKEQTQEKEKRSIQKQEKTKQTEEVVIKDKKCGEFPCYTSDEFVQVYENFEKESGLPILPKYIYNNKKADEHIRQLAEKRGYKKRVFADETKLVSFGKYRTQPALLKNYRAMRDAMKKEGISLHFVSGYRSSSHQRRIFKNKMGNINVGRIQYGDYDEKINRALEISAIPGYSKHHSGYAVDFGCGNDYLVYSFNTTKCYEWLTKNNFENAKRFGFIPSYPKGVTKQGPNPESWEFLWVGRDRIQHFFDHKI